MILEEFPNYYIYENGDIYNIKTGKELKQKLDKYGYKKICLCNNNIKYTKTIHRLVANTFLPKVNNKNQVDHIDRNKLNNNVENLRWVNNSENQSNTYVMKNNKLGVKNISIKIIKNTKYYLLSITRNKKNILNKSYNSKKYTLNDVIKIRDDFLKNANINF